MIAIIGATGTIGRPVVAGLLERSVDARVLSRCADSVFDDEARSWPAGAIDVVIGSAASRSVIDELVRGCDRVFLSMANSPVQESIERNVIDACATAGVHHLVKVSAPDVRHDVSVGIARMHGRIEQAAIAAGLTCSFLRPFGFMQNLSNVIPQILHTGSFIGSSGSAPINFVDVRDIADVAVGRLLDSNPAADSYVLTGPHAYTRDDLAEMFTRHGVPATYVDLTPQDHRLALSEAGLPPWLVEHLVEIDALAVQRPQRPNRVIETMTGRPARTLEQFVGEFVSSLVPAAAAAD